MSDCKFYIEMSRVVGVEINSSQVAVRGRVAGPQLEYLLVVGDGTGVVAEFSPVSRAAVKRLDEIRPQFLSLPNNDRSPPPSARLARIKLRRRGDRPAIRALLLMERQMFRTGGANESKFHYSGK
jgi:hypothetical protein